MPNLHAKPSKHSFFTVTFHSASIRRNFQTTVFNSVSGAPLIFILSPCCTCMSVLALLWYPLCFLESGNQRAFFIAKLYYFTIFLPSVHTNWKCRALFLPPFFNVSFIVHTKDSIVFHSCQSFFFFPVCCCVHGSTKSKRNNDFHSPPSLRTCPLNLVAKCF